MSIEGSDFLDFASTVIAPGASEVALRSGAGRAYYAAFHSLAPFADKLPRSRVCPTAVDRVNHRELIERLKEWRTAGVHPRLAAMAGTKSALWRAVEAACQARVKADYLLGGEFTLAEAQTQIERVKKILRHTAAIEDAMVDAGEGDEARTRA